jgi:integrase
MSHFLNAVQDDPLEALYVLALTTGMRQGELLALKWEDLDLESGAVQVRRTIARLVGKGLSTGVAKRENPPWGRVEGVGLGGLEPPTHGLGNRRSIH